MIKRNQDKGRVCVVGAGVMGTQIALLTAMTGLPTVLIGRTDRSLANAKAELERRFAELDNAGLADRHAAGWPSRLSYGNAPDAATDADVVIEAIVEDVAAKARLFAHLDEITNRSALLLSSTSGLPVDAMAAQASHRDRIAVAHFANPPHLMPTVELVPGTETSSETMDRAEHWLRNLGKIPIRLKRDLPGHLFNRIQFAMLREAMALVRDGVADAADVDAVVKHGLALRLAEEGPIEKMDLAGLDLVARVAGQLFPDLDHSTTPDHILQLLSNGRTGAAAGHGFYDWTPDHRDTVITRRNSEVMRHLIRLREQGLLVASKATPARATAEET